MNIFKKIAAFSVSGILAAGMLLSGCSLRSKLNRPELPANPESFKMTYDDDTGMHQVSVFGRTYMPFGSLEGRMNDNYIRECLGYINSDKETRVYSISQDPYDNYIIVENTNGNSIQSLIWRDFATYKEDILTPEFIKSDSYESWQGSEMHYEAAEFVINVTVDIEDIKILTMVYSINGKAGGSLKTGYTDGSNPEKGEVFRFTIDEVCLNGKADTDEPFETEIHFIITSEDGSMHDASGCFKGTVRTGDETELELTGDRSSGYEISDGINQQ